MKLIVSIVVAAALAGGGCATTAEPAALPAIADAVSPAPGIVSAGRLQPDDIARVREASVRHVIDLTPDVETPRREAASAWANC